MHRDFHNRKPRDFAVRRSSQGSRGATCQSSGHSKVFELNSGGGFAIVAGAAIIDKRGSKDQVKTGAIRAAVQLCIRPQMRSTSDGSCLPGRLEASSTKLI